ncbi:hypothetical protein ACMWE4_28195, partial [Klebsiella pneumoniae]
CCRDLQGGEKYPSYFKLQRRWLRSLTPVTYLSKLLGIRCVAAFLQLELFRVYRSNPGLFNLFKQASLRR